MGLLRQNGIDRTTAFKRKIASNLDVSLEVETVADLVDATLIEYPYQWMMVSVHTDAIPDNRGVWVLVNIADRLNPNSWKQIVNSDGLIAQDIDLTLFILNKALTSTPQDANINVAGGMSSSQIFAQNPSAYTGEDETDPDAPKVDFVVFNRETRELSLGNIDEIIGNGEDLPVDPTPGDDSDFVYGQTVFGLSEVPFIFEKAGKIIAIKTRNMNNIMFRKNSGNAAVPTFPYTFAADDVLWVSWNYVDVVNNSANILLLGGDN